jgi:hypothetical protein
MNKTVITMEDLKLNEEKSEKNSNEQTHEKDNIFDRTFNLVKEFSHKGKAKITERLQQIEKEMDLERVLHLNLATIALAGVALSYSTEDKDWLYMPAAAVLLLAVDTAFCLTAKVPLLRRLGLRLKDEILHERYALKAFCGDFKHTDSPDTVWEAAE